MQRCVTPKQYAAESVKVSQSGGDLRINFGVKITQEGTVKPSEILSVLRENFGLNVDALLSRGQNLLDIVGGTNENTF